MGIQIINIIIFVCLFAMLLLAFGFKAFAHKPWAAFIRTHISLLVIMLCINTVSFALTLKKPISEYHIERQAYDGQEKTYSFRLTDGEQQSEISLSVSPMKMTGEEAIRRMEEAFRYLDQHLQGENASLMRASTDLDIGLPYEEFPFDLELIPADYGLLDDNGVIKNEKKDLLAAGYSEYEIAGGIPSSLTVILWYGDERREKNYELLIFPREQTDWDRRVFEVQELFEKTEQDSLYESGFELPASLDGVQIEGLSGGGISSGGVLLLGFIVAVLLLLSEAEKERKQKLLRQQELLRAYPWFINELVLLLGAGMQVKNIFSLLVQDDRAVENDYRSALMEELKNARKNFDIGISEGRIYYELGRRLQLPCYIKVMTLLEQNVTKGSKGLVAILEQEERSALEERMNLAKRSGEEAGTKLLGPMILLLLIIMLMIMIPAFMSFA